MKSSLKKHRKPAKSVSFSLPSLHGQRKNVSSRCDEETEDAAGVDDDNEYMMAAPPK